MNERQNHPKKGTKIKVEPIRREMKDIQTVKRLLADKPRDLCLFNLGINTNLRASDLLSITAGQVRGMKPGEDLELKEKKTRKLRRITLNKACINAITALLASKPYHDKDRLFQGQRGPITVSYLNRLVKRWTKALNLRGNYGSHTLRKTFGYGSGQLDAFGKLFFSDSHFPCTCKVACRSRFAAHIPNCLPF